MKNLIDGVGGNNSINVIVKCFQNHGANMREQLR
jgi:hypothetical protein